MVTAILSRPHFYLHHDSAPILKDHCCLVLASNEREMAMLLRMLLSASSMLAAFPIIRPGSFQEFYAYIYGQPRFMRIHAHQSVERQPRTRPRRGYRRERYVSALGWPLRSL